MDNDAKKLKIAFVVGAFPSVSETFIINQVADLAERGIEADIYSLKRGDLEGVSQRYHDYGMGGKTRYLDMPKNFLARSIFALPLLLNVLFSKPGVLLKIFNLKRYGRDSWSLKLLFQAAPFLGKEYDIVHCHFGKIANRYLMIREILGTKEKLITSFYGFDVSMIFRQKPADYYDKLKKTCSRYFVMSNNMKERVVKHGFPADKIRVLPVSINTAEYPFKERKISEGETINILSVGRFVPKKGFDDFLRAIAIVKEKTAKKIAVKIIGGGPMEKDLLQMTKDLKIEDVTEYKGYMKIEEVINYFLQMHLFVQPSKTAPDGDME